MVMLPVRWTEPVTLKICLSGMRVSAYNSWIFRRKILSLPRVIFNKKLCEPNGTQRPILRLRSVPYVHQQYRILHLQKVYFVVITWRGYGMFLLEIYCRVGVSMPFLMCFCCICWRCVWSIRCVSLWEIKNTGIKELKVLYFMQLCLRMSARRTIRGISEYWLLPGSI